MYIHTSLSLSIYIYIYIYVYVYSLFYYVFHFEGPRFYVPQRGVQWKQGVVIYMTLYTSLLYDTTPIHCTPLRLHPPLRSIHL